MRGGIVRAWHFVGTTLRDGRPIPPRGKWLVHTGPVQICRSGLHASLRPCNALGYAPGPILCRVECADLVIRHPDKFVCRRRRIVARIDATELLRYYARMQAVSIIHLWPEHPPDVVLDYLMIGSEPLRRAAVEWAQGHEPAMQAIPYLAAAVWTAAATTNVVSAAAWAQVSREAQKAFDDLVYETFGEEA